MNDNDFFETWPRFLQNKNKVPTCRTSHRLERFQTVQREISEEIQMIKLDKYLSTKSKANRQ